MATDLAASVNGMYGTEYGQPAELAASVPSSTQASAVSQSATESATNTTIADPQQIGWYFVEQYYTTLSKNPDQIHLFYSKKSQLVTGVEAEKVVPSVGSKVSLFDLATIILLIASFRPLGIRSRNSIFKTAKSAFSMSTLKPRLAISSSR